MYEPLSLFDQPELTFKRDLAVTLRRLAGHRLFLGSSSWKYLGWLGPLYSPARYRSKGRFSRKNFEDTCLLEYAETFPIVSGDFAFYQFPSAAFWRGLFSQVQPPFQFAFKIPEEITLSTFPNHARYGARAEQGNPHFLSTHLLQTQFLDLLKPYSEQVSLLVFEFAASNQRDFSALQFAAALSPFFAALPKHFRYGVEIRHPDFLHPAYFRSLREHGVAHVFNSWSGMPGIPEQMQNAEAFTANFTAARALLRPGRAYEESVRLFSPYSAIREPNHEVRQALRQLLIRAKDRAEPSYLFINNRLEGFAPGTIAAVSEGF